MSADKDPLLILKTAAENERLGYNFFQQAAQITHDPNGQKMFTFLGKEEVKHLNLILAEMDSLRAGKGWIDPNTAIEQRVEIDFSKPIASENEMLQAGVKYDWQDPIEVVKDASNSMQADLGVLDVGMRTERYFYNMYKEACEKLKDTAGVAPLEFLMKQENLHFKLLQEARDYLADNETWWDEWQKPIFEGG